MPATTGSSPSSPPSLTTRPCTRCGGRRCAGRSRCWSVRSPTADAPSTAPDGRASLPRPGGAGRAPCPAAAGCPAEVSAVRDTDAVGEYGERLAIRHLESLGYVVLERRWRCARGELDIVAVD